MTSDELFETYAAALREMWRTASPSRAQIRDLKTKHAAWVREFAPESSRVLIRVFSAKIDKRTGKAA
jgi:hypothetical protein